MVGVAERATKITAERSRNGFNIATSSIADAGNRHPFELIEFWQEL
jgi:hypothetical protein